MVRLFLTIFLTLIRCYLIWLKLFLFQVKRFVTLVLYNNFGQWVLKDKLGYKGISDMVKPGSVSEHKLIHDRVIICALIKQASICIFSVVIRKRSSMDNLLCLSFFVSRSFSLYVYCMYNVYIHYAYIFIYILQVTGPDFEKARILV